MHFNARCEYSCLVHLELNKLGQMIKSSLNRALELLEWTQKYDYKLVILTDALQHLKYFAIKVELRKIQLRRQLVTVTNKD